ncbi:hypothetical protein [Paractinoplanes durhamensis]|uniref:Uncharacterized protein n=1 Tax=Paractinoplanes durhamensis TaxID=113563 RepID=A0ABQ3ZCC5_9ACTN|nr:hypothetical protein [Actinoplanes durhamensis]GIE07472.1 hypothetical protein Adu01nite_88220 [Actinoplanes durhamensis]
MTYPENIDLEVPEADAAEQRASTRFEGDDDRVETSGNVEAPDWDASEQNRVVDLEDDDYR